MRSLYRALLRADEFLPWPWDSLTELAKLRPGNLCIAQSAPGVGKSSLALVHALYLAEEHGLPSLICSLDTDPRVQALRVLANLRSRRIAEIEEDLEENASWLEEHPNLVRWVWEAKLSDLEEIIEAERVYLGRTPAMVVVDNAGDMVAEESPQGYVSLFRGLHRIARRFDTAILALHHLNRGRNPDRDITSGRIAPYLGESLYGGEKEAELVLGLWRERADQLSIGVLKNRTGEDDRWGKLNVKLEADLSRAKIEESQGED